MAETNPTDTNYIIWRRAYDHFNAGGSGAPPASEELETQSIAQLRKQQTEELRKKKTASKSRYTCPGCDLPKHVWGKPGLHVICGECGGRFEADASDDGAGENWSLWGNSRRTHETQSEICPQISQRQGRSEATVKTTRGV